MKDFNHSNVLSLIGVAIKDNNKPFVILPYMEHGDLKSYISNPDRVKLQNCAISSDKRSISNQAVHIVFRPITFD